MSIRDYELFFPHPRRWPRRFMRGFRLLSRKYGLGVVEVGLRHEPELIGRG
jgi:hypothetical protein